MGGEILSGWTAGGRPSDLPLLINAVRVNWTIGRTAFCCTVLSGLFG